MTGQKTTRTECNLKVKDGSFSTTANAQAFISDLAKAFGGQQGKELTVKVSLAGPGILTYAINSVAVCVNEVE